jgi:hypothetical protein
LDGDDALLVEPDALENEREELALGDGVALSRRQKIEKSWRTCWAWSRSGSGPGALAASSVLIASRRAMYSGRVRSPIS